MSAAMEGRALSETTLSKTHIPPSANHAANGQPAGLGKKAVSPTQLGAGEGFAGIAAKMFNSKVKEQGKESAGRKKSKHNGCDDDLPLGSEAHSLSLDHGGELQGSQPPEDRRSKWSKTASQQGPMGWQSFNSDVSNQTSASSASLEQILNDRQVDPEEMLFNLGFGGQSQDMMPSLARIPERFLHHPSRTYGVAPPNQIDDAEAGAADETAAAAMSVPDGGSSAAPAAMPSPKRRTGLWTLTRTLSLLRMKTLPARGRPSFSSTTSGPQTQGHPVSILHPANQRYLASRGYYEKQGWPKGTFAEPEEDILSEQKAEDESKDAASKRKMFKKARSRRNWSLCDSGEDEMFPADKEWRTKSVDDPHSREDFPSQDDSLGRGAYFSTTTESSTDSLETPNLETARAFEEIRREFNENRSREHLSSEDLTHKNRLGSGDSTHNGEVHCLDLLNTYETSTNYFVSPASSRQTTVEKAPTISEQSLSIAFADDMPSDGKNNGDNPDSDVSKHAGSTHKMIQEEGGDVCIIISKSDGSKNQESENQHVKSSRLSVENVQTASSDSGSSSATAIGSGSVILIADEPTRRLSDLEFTDWDSISRRNSPYSFGHGRTDGHRQISQSCQTTDADFEMASAVASCQNATGLSSSSKTSGQPRSGVDNEKKKKEFASLELSPKVQLSPFPTTINHLELMRRLQQTQNELSRMGSVQSDSSGFADADPGVEPGNGESEAVKHASLASSMESCRTLTGTAKRDLTLPHYGEIATQTGLELEKVKTGRDVVDAGRRQSSKPADESHNYVTMCYIPTLAAKPGQPEGMRYNVGNGSHWNAGHQPSYGQTSVGHQVWRSRSGSESRLGFFTQFDNLIRTGRGLRSDPSHRFTGTSDQRWYGHHGHSSHYQSDQNIRGQSGSSASQPKDSTSRKVFTSQIDLVTNASGFSKKEFSCDDPTSNLVGFRRHSDEGILDRRNNKPLSVELALARDSKFAASTPPPSASSTVPLTSPATWTVMVTAAVTAATSTMKSTTSKNTDPTPQSSVPGGPAMTTPSHYKTESGFHYPFLAGNIAAVPSHSLTMSTNTQNPRSTFRQRSCDILDDDTEDSISAQSQARVMDDFDTCSSVAETSSDFSMQSSGDGQSRVGILESRKLARLINQPLHFRGIKRCGSQYRPRHLFKEWSLLSKRKRLQEENRLMQMALHKYKTELSILEASLLVDSQAVYADLTDEDREDLEELDWLWGEVKVQIMEIEQVLMSRVKSVHAGCDIYSLLSSLGIVQSMVELIKEQIYQQKMASARSDEGADRGMDEEMAFQTWRRSSYQSPYDWAAAGMSTPQSIRRFQSSSTSSLPQDLSISLEQIKASVLSQVKSEIKESNKKLEDSLQEKDREIKRLQEHLVSRTLSDPQPRRWTPRSSVSRSQKVMARSRSLIAKQKATQETDV